MEIYKVIRVYFKNHRYSTFHSVVFSTEDRYISYNNVK